MLLGLMRSLARDRSGASAAEYALLLGVVGTAFVLASFNLGQAIATSLERSASLFASRSEPVVAAAAAAAGEGGEAPGSATAPTGAPKGTGVASAKANENGVPHIPNAGTGSSNASNGKGAVKNANN